MPTLHFRIPYRTYGDEHLRVRFNTSNGASGTTDLKPVADRSMWFGELPLPNGTEWVNYEYEVAAEPGGSVLRHEAHPLRRIYPQKRSHLQLLDSWSEEGINPVYLHTAFTRTVYGPRHGQIVSGLQEQAHLLLLVARPAPRGYRWGVLGSTPSLGEWKPSRAVALARTQVYEYACPLTADDIDNGFEYKFVLLDERRPGTILWEEGSNRRVAPTPSSVPAVFVQASSPRFALKPWRGAGVVVPVFSLRSLRSWGTGDFGDLQRFTDWAASVGMQAIQLLPLNDTTRTGSWRDSYPYSGISVFALHPLYLDPSPWADTSIYKECAEKGRALNELPELDYEKAFALKMRFLRSLYRSEGRRQLQSAAYRRFAAANEDWLDSYAEFCARRDKNCTADFRKWDDKPATAPEMAFWRFVQFLLHRQLAAVREHASGLGIILKGDIPIGVSPDSVDVWREPQLFHTDGQAGAPPDYFSADGQNWGFPTYNWEQMKEDGYAWWRRRFRTMAQYFDAYRIDHVLGFFRIWEIPFRHFSGMLGRFRPALPLSSDELRGFGFTLPPAQFTRPRIAEGRFARLCDEAGPGLERFFQKEGGYRTLRPEAASQRGAWSLTTDNRLRSTLMKVITDILFIEDDQRPSTFHPRIGAQQTETYAALPPAERQAFDRIHQHYFYERHNNFWARAAREKFNALLSTDSPDKSLLPCAEDLGMVPACVPGVLRETGVLTLEIQTMPKVSGREFADLAQNPWLSVATIATHDMAPLRLWWQLDHGRTQRFWNDVLHRSGEAPAEAPAEACEQVIRQHLACPSMLCLIALQDYLAMDATLRRDNPADEQINDPGNGAHYWRYRMHLTIEQLFSAVNWGERLRLLISDSGR